VSLTANATPAVYSTTSDIVRNLSLVRDEIADTAAKIDEQQIAGLARHLGQPGRVFVAGAGRSGLVLRMAAMRLMHLGLDVHVAGDTTTPAITSGDLLLVGLRVGNDLGTGQISGNSGEGWSAYRRVYRLFEVPGEWSAEMIAHAAIRAALLKRIRDL